MALAAAREEEDDDEENIFSSETKLTTCVAKVETSEIFVSVTGEGNSKRLRGTLKCSQTSSTSNGRRPCALHSPNG